MKYMYIEFICYLGYVEWKEYYKYFLLVKGYGLNEIEKYLEDYDIDIL